MLTSTIKSLAQNMSQNKFTGGENNMTLFVNLVTLVVLVTLMLFVGKYIWNEVLVKLVTSVKPVENPIDLLLLMLLTNMLFCCK